MTIDACTARLKPGDDVAKALAGGGVVCLAAGRYVGGLWIEGSVTIQGEEGVIIDANGRGPAIFVNGEGARVVVRRVTLTNGHSELGGGVRVSAWADVSFEDCVIEGNVGQQNGGNGAGVGSGTVRFARTAFGPLDDLLLTGASEVEFDDCAIAGRIRLREGSQVRVVGGSVAGPIDVCGTTTRAPRLEVVGTNLGGGITNDDELPGEIVGA